jgi:hypothetical protein
MQEQRSLARNRRCKDGRVGCKPVFAACANEAQLDVAGQRRLEQPAIRVWRHARSRQQVDRAASARPSPTIEAVPSRLIGTDPARM